jgi:YHS domain-containing protein
MIIRRTALFGIAATTLLGAHSAWAQNASKPATPLALQGYDPVAYFTDGKPVEGKADYELAWDGQRYRFASAQHRDLFKVNPDKYAPQFGGSCAMNMSAGVRRESDPHNWVITNGNLYVFAGVRGMENFKQNIAENSSKAATNWKSMKPVPTQ